MKTYFSIKNWVLLIVTLCIFQGCSSDDDISYDLAGNWKVIYFMDGNTIITKSDDNTWPDINNGDITATFTQPDSNGKGTISGITVTNGYQGDYTVQNNGKITIESVTSTLINEPEWTKLFRITSAENFEIKNSVLLISYNNKENIIALERN